MLYCLLCKWINTILLYSVCEWRCMFGVLDVISFVCCDVVLMSGCLVCPIFWAPFITWCCWCWFFVCVFVQFCMVYYCDMCVLYFWFGKLTLTPIFTCVMKLCLLMFLAKEGSSWTNQLFMELYFWCEIFCHYLHLYNRIHSIVCKSCVCLA